MQRLHGQIVGQPALYRRNTTTTRPAHMMQWATTVAMSAPVMSNIGNRMKLRMRLTTAELTMNHWSCSKWPSTAR